MHFPPLQKTNAVLWQYPGNTPDENIILFQEDTA
jgi:hypothetical protein